MTTRSPLSPMLDRKSTRLNSSHGSISYAVFCLKKKTSMLYCAHLADLGIPFHDIFVTSEPRQILTSCPLTGKAIRTGLNTGQFLIVFFFKDATPTEIYTLSLHDALPI